MRWRHWRTFGTAMSTPPPGVQQLDKLRQDLGRISQMFEHMGEHQGIEPGRLQVRRKILFDVEDPAGIQKRPSGRGFRRGDGHAADGCTRVALLEEHGVVARTAADIEHASNRPIQEVEQGWVAGIGVYTFITGDGFGSVHAKCKQGR